MILVGCGYYHVKMMQWSTYMKKLPAYTFVLGRT